MAARQVYTLTCDHPGCTAMYQSLDELAGTARANARKLGWVHHTQPRLAGPWASKDFCPVHTPKPQ